MTGERINRQDLLRNLEVIVARICVQLVACACYSYLIISQARTWMLSHFPWANALDDARFGALLNLSYNLGGKLLGFHKALSAFEAGDYEGAAREFADSAWKTQVGDRATRLCEQIRTGVWQ